MTTLRSIINDAYRESGIIQKGLAPDADQLQEGLTKLRSIILNVYGEEVGTQLADANYGSHSVTGPYQTKEGDEFLAYLNSSPVPDSVRLVANIGAPQTVYLDTHPQDGQRFAVIDAAGTFGTHNLTINAGSRTIEGSRTRVMNINNESGVWFYRADTANWVKVDTLTEDSDMPFPFEFDDFFIMKLATRLHPRYLVQTTQETMMHYKDLLRRFRSRYNITRNISPELALRLVHPWRTGHSYGGQSESLFDKGLI